MTDAQQLFDYARNHINELADDVERHFNHVAGKLRENFARNIPQPPPVRRLPPPTALQLVQRWILRHRRALTAAAVAFVITGSVGSWLYVKNSHGKRKRRAKRSQSGARTEVVVVAGAVANPLASALYLDLERRGFVVYVVSSTAEDEHFIRSQSRADLFPLSLDLLDPYTARDQLARFQHHLTRQHAAFEGAEPHRLTLTGLILIPDTSNPPAKIEDISSEEWSDALNAKVLNTIATTQLLLPAVLEHHAHILLLTPSATPSLRPPTHAVESTVYGALQSFTASLAAELAADPAHPVAVSHFRLGAIDIPAVTAKLRREGATSSLSSSAALSSSHAALRPTPLRVLHDAVFDALTATRAPRSVYVGRGAFTYDVIGHLVPPGLIAWMMGVGRRRRTAAAAAAATREEESMSGSAGSLTWEKVEQEA